MNNYFVAPSYQTYERVGSPFYNKNGKLCTKVKDKCPRCSGVGIIVARVENEQLIPIPVDNGICYSCLGKKYIEKEVRLYTESEYKTMQKNNERARLKREQERNTKIEAEFENNKKKWLLENGFNENEITYIYSGSDSYFIKAQLKEDGYKFNSILLWHKSTKDEKYINNLIEVNFNDIAEWSAWGQAHYLSTAKEFINNLLDEAKAPSASEWIGEIGERLKKIPVTLVGKYSYEGRYGMSQVIKFQDENQNLLTWFTAVYIPYEIGDSCLLTATIKEHSEYKGEKSTIITRAKLEEI